MNSKQNEDDHTQRRRIVQQPEKRALFEDMGGKKYSEQEAQPASEQAHSGFGDPSQIDAFRTQKFAWIYESLPVPSANLFYYE